MDQNRKTVQDFFRRHHAVATSPKGGFPDLSPANLIGQTDEFLVEWVKTCIQMDQPGLPMPQRRWAQDAQENLQCEMAIRRVGMRPGDTVVCIDDRNGAHFLRQGEEFKVQSVQIDDGGCLRLNLIGMARAWEWHRFEKISKGTNGP